MIYTTEKSLYDFQPWSGAQFTWEILKENGDLEAIEEEITEYYEGAGEIPSETDINDFLWFETDMIAEYLGYEDWGTYCAKRKEDKA